jgi:hypothetical protein
MFSYTIAKDKGNETVTNKDYFLQYVEIVNMKFLNISYMD